jgi:hypothetical protein
MLTSLLLTAVKLNGIKKERLLRTEASKIFVDSNFATKCIHMSTISKQ